MDEKSDPHAEQSRAEYAAEKAAEPLRNSRIRSITKPNADYSKSFEPWTSFEIRRMCCWFKSVESHWSVSMLRNGFPRGRLARACPAHICRLGTKMLAGEHSALDGPLILLQDVVKVLD